MGGREGDKAKSRTNILFKTDSGFSDCIPISPPNPSDRIIQLGKNQILSGKENNIKIYKFQKMVPEEL